MMVVGSGLEAQQVGEADTHPDRSIWTGLPLGDWRANKSSAGCRLLTSSYRQAYRSRTTEMSQPGLSRMSAHWFATISVERLEWAQCRPAVPVKLAVRRLTGFKVRLGESCRSRTHATCAFNPSLEHRRGIWYTIRQSAI